MLITISLYVLRPAPLVPGLRNPSNVPEMIDLENPRSLLEDFLKTACGLIEDFLRTARQTL